MVALLFVGGCTPPTVDYASQTSESTVPTSGVAATVTPSAEPTAPSTAATTAPATKPVAPGTVKIFGLCAKPVTLTLAALKGWGVETATVDYPKKGKVKVSGVKFMKVLTNVDVSESSAYALFTSASGTQVQVPLSDTVASPDAMLEIDSTGKVNGVFPGAEFSDYWMKNIVSVQFK